MTLNYDDIYLNTLESIVLFHNSHLSPYNIISMANQVEIDRKNIT